MIRRFHRFGTSEVHMNRSRRTASRRDGERGQILVIAVISMIAMIGGISLVLEGGNAYAHQRVVQNGSDAVANAGALAIAQRLGGAIKTDADVKAAAMAMSGSNLLDGFAAYYSDVKGNLLTLAGTPAANTASAAQVGNIANVIPAGAQGIQVSGTQLFPTTFARVIGMNDFRATADATAVAGALTGGIFLPVVFPVNIVDCDASGSLGIGEAAWDISEPGEPPIGQEYIVPLCKTGAGSFMVLDLDGITNNCDEEVRNPPKLAFAAFPADVASDNGNNCAKPMADEVNKLAGKIVLIPICDGYCTTTGGSNATYHIIRVAAFYLDYMVAENPGGSGHDPLCQGNGTTLVPIVGNGSSSCLVGWFVRYITSGPVGSGNVDGAGAIGIQLIR
jgi:hypothetical protein